MIKDFAEHQWSSTIQEMQSDSGGLEFPSVVICNVNRIKWSKAQEYNLTTDMIQLMFVSLALHNQYTISKYNFSALSQYREWRAAHNFSFLDIFDNLGPQIEDIFIQKDFSTQYRITPFFTIEYGRCWRVDFNYSSNTVGSKGGKIMLLDSQVWDYLPLLYNNHLHEGLALQIAYDGRVELGQWITIQPGTRTAIAIQAYEDSIRQEESSTFNPFTLLKSKPPCTLHPTLQFSDLSQYTVSNCKLDCNFLRTVRACQCIPYFRNAHYRSCEAEEHLTCFGYKSTPSIVLSADELSARSMGLDIQTDLSGNSFISTPVEVQAEVSNCGMGCEKRCKDRYVQTQLYVTNAPTERQVDQLQALLNGSDTKRRTQDVILLEIYFGTMVKKTVELYEVMNLENMISSSGGLIGLWAGMSFLTALKRRR
uniref:Uncharacterized protein n=1 Tax=Plectus sambesii TaxID=2011161 RepID=A0A914UY47_9BILA